MMREVQSIPPAPRRVRARTLLGHRWPMLLLGALLAVYGGLWTLMLWFGDGAKPSDHHRLDAADSARVPGHVLAVGEPRRSGDEELVPVRYAYAFGDDAAREAVSLAQPGQFAPHQAVTVEVRPEAPNISRIVGTRLHRDRAWLRPLNWLLGVVAPGWLVLAAWGLGVLRLRRVLVHGDVAVAHVARVRRLPFVLPPTCVVDYAFRDHRARDRHGRHWVRARSALGQRLLRRLGAGAEFGHVPVLHDRRRPQRNRLVLPEDCLPGPGTALPAGLRP